MWVGLIILIVGFGLLVLAERRAKQDLVKARLLDVLLESIRREKAKDFPNQGEIDLYEQTAAEIIQTLPAKDVRKVMKPVIDAQDQDEH